jgi:hypothetical protein
MLFTSIDDNLGLFGDISNIKFSITPFDINLIEVNIFKGEKYLNDFISIFKASKYFSGYDEVKFKDVNFQDEIKTWMLENLLIYLKY